MSKNPAQKKGTDKGKKPPTPEVEEETPIRNEEQAENYAPVSPGEDLNLNKSQHMPQQQEEEEIPEDKDELIEYLKSKLYKTQSTIQEAFGVLEEQKEMTGKLAGEFEAKKREIAKIQQDQNRSIREKVHEKVETTLQRVVSEKVDAEMKNIEMKRLIGEKEMMIKELEWTLKNLQVENTEKEYELKELTDKHSEQTRLLEALENKKIKMEEEGAEQDEQIKRLMREKDDTKGAILKLTDVKNVLNRLLSDPASLYGNSSEIVGKEREHREHREPAPKETSSQPMQSQSTKPGYLNNEEDFWYGDPAKQPYAKDYGGKEKNYNQRYNYNNKVQNAPENMGNSPHQSQEGFKASAAKEFSPASSMRTSKKKVY